MKTTKIILLAISLGMSFFFILGNAFAADSAMMDNQKGKMETPMMHNDAGMQQASKEMKKQMNTMEGHKKSDMKKSMQDSKKMMK